MVSEVVIEVDHGLQVGVEILPIIQIAIDVGHRRSIASHVLEAGPDGWVRVIRSPVTDPIPYILIPSVNRLIEPVIEQPTPRVSTNRPAGILLPTA